VYNILIFPSWFPSKNNPLNAIFTKKHIDLISLSNKTVVVYAEKVLKQEDSYSLEKIINQNYSVYTCFYKANTNYFIVVRKAVNFTRRVNAYIKAIQSTKVKITKFDFIHIHVVGFESIIPLFYKFFKKVPFFVSEHSTVYLTNTSIHSINTLFKRLIIQQSSGISVVSKALKNGIEKLNINHDNFVIIPNYVDEQKFCYTPREKNKKVKFLHISRLDEKAKNVIGILNSFEDIFKSNKDIELHIVGGFIGDISEAEKHSAHLDSNSNIYFHGIKLGDEILKYYHQADIIIMFSNYETQGVVTLEALFCGLNVLATNLPCLKEYLNNNNSVLVNPKDEKQLKKNMQLFLDKKWNVWAPKKIAEEIKERFSSKKISADFLSFYKNGLLE
jgi:glycosyltransferase involved in cell wall biosynthesis